MESTRSATAQIEEWLLKTAHIPDGGRSFTRDFVDRLNELGAPLWRVSLSLLTKHPEVLWRTIQWRESDGIKIIDRRYETLQEPFFTDSPVALLMRGAPDIRVRLANEASRFPICIDLARQGGTDYYAQALRFTNGQTSYVSWATRDPGGFKVELLQVLRAIGPSLARRIEIESAYHATRALLEVYLGRNAARRVTEGAFRRGGGELIQSAIWFCDLRDFTSMSDQMTPYDVVAMLDAYFDRVAGAVTTHGGEVLKFIGDAVLAIFPTGVDRAAACRNALEAAKDAIAALQEFNHVRPDDPHLKIGVALHMGEVMYGNIGSRERLDFTVISSAVNEACRIEGLCKILKTPLAMSETFADSLEGEEIVDLGSYDLKGVKVPVRVFTLQKYLA